MTVVTIKRSLVKTFLNTGTTGTPIWSLIGDGVTSGQIAYNPKTLSEIYIHQDTGITQVESYAPTIAIEATAKNGDAVFEFIDALRKSRAVLDATNSEIVNVWMYETGGPTAYPAEKQSVNIQIDTFGGDGGAAAKIGYTINYLGDPTTGTFNGSTLAFT